MVTIAVDAMGGDKAPGPEIEGALRAAKEYGHRVLLVGTKSALEHELGKHGGARNLPIEIVDAPERITMDDHAAKAARTKRKSSMHICARAVASGEADGFVSAGNTGACMAIAKMMLGKLPGVDMIGHNWLVNPLSFFFVASVIITWASVPFVAFSVYAAFTTVGEEVIEAAAIDGATRGQLLRRIILPIIRPVLGIVLLLQLIWDMRVFAQIKLLQDAGSFGSQYDLLGTYIYKLGTGSQDFGTASAAAMVVMFLTLGLSVVYIRRMLKEDEES